MTTERSFLLVPGAGGDSWYWHLVAPLLRARGHHVLAPDLPAADDDAGLSDYADVLAAAAHEHSRVIVVAQSMGAFPATTACDRIDAALLVLVVPMIPAPGESPGRWWTSSGQTAAQHKQDRRDGRDPDAEFDVMTAFFHDVPPDVVEAAFARGEPRQADKPFAEPWPLDRWPDVPTRVIAGRHDRLLPLGFLRRLARERVGVECDVVDSGHLPALAAPRELADLLLTYAAEPADAAARPPEPRG